VCLDEKHDRGMNMESVKTSGHPRYKTGGTNTDKSGPVELLGLPQTDRPYGRDSLMVGKDCSRFPIIRRLEHMAWRS